MDAYEARRIAICSRYSSEIDEVEAFVRGRIFRAASQGGTCINWMFDGYTGIAREEVRTIIRARLMNDGYRVDKSNETVRWD